MSNLIHGMSGTKEYHTWESMIQRCTNPNHVAYKNYGGRGITVCERWLKFTNFLEDMGKRPKGLTIERNNNDKGYYKENCKWATRTDQVRNRGLNKNNKSGVIGVAFCKTYHKYRAYIDVNYRRYHLGYFKILEHAIKARRCGEQKHWKKENEI